MYKNNSIFLICVTNFLVSIAKCSIFIKIKPPDCSGGYWGVAVSFGAYLPFSTKRTKASLHRRLPPGVG